MIATTVWDTGPTVRVQQLKNYFTFLLLSAGGVDVGAG